MDNKQNFKKILSSVKEPLTASLVVLLMTSFCLALLFVPIGILYAVGAEADKHYDKAMNLVENGDLIGAIDKCKSPFMKDSGRRKIPMLEAILLKDVDKTVETIRSLPCYGKCFHMPTEWTYILVPYSKAQTTEQEKLDLIAYGNSVIEQLEIEGESPDVDLAINEFKQDMQATLE